MPESQSSKLRKEWPWDWNKPEELTDEVVVRIVKNLYSYAKDVAYWYPEESGWHYWFGGLKVYCKVSRDYFIKVTKEAPDSIKPMLSKIVEDEAYELINMLLKWANEKFSNCFVEPDKRYYTITCSDEELENEWEMVLAKLQLSISSGSQQQEQSTRKRPTKAEMENRNRAVAMAAAKFKTEHDRLPTVDEIVGITKYSRNQIYSTDAYEEEKIAKSSAKVSTEMMGGSVHETEYYSKKSEEHGRAKKRSKAEQAEMDALIDEQKKDDKSDRVQ